MAIIREDLVLIKTFLNCFNIEYNNNITNVLNELKELDKINLYKNEEKIGELSYCNGIYKIHADLGSSILTAKVKNAKEEQRFKKIINYKLQNYNNDKILGIYKVNNNGENCKYNLRNKNTIKNSFSIFSNGEEISYFKLFTVKNYTYIVDRIKDEYVNFSNDVLSHGVDNKYTHVGYDLDDDIINYSHFFKEEGQDLTYTGGYNLYKDADEKDFGMIRKNYRKVIEEFDSRYKCFIQEQRKLLDEFDEGLFDRFINVILTTLTKEEKDYIFKKELVKESVFKKVK